MATDNHLQPKENALFKRILVSIVYLLYYFVRGLTKNRNKLATEPVPARRFYSFATTKPAGPGTHYLQGRG